MKEEELKSLRKKLKECQKLKEEYLAGWQRARADLINYKKNEMERISELLKNANTDLILNILPILDNFEIAIKEIRNQKSKIKDSEKIIKGFLQIKNQFQDFLKSQGVEEIKSIGEKFDPNFHEVIAQIEVRDKESGIIIEEIQKGYKIHGKVLRPAKVKVSK